MKNHLILLVTLLMLSPAALSQPERVGAGLSFAAKKRFNGGDTGNPGLNLKGWISLNKRKTMHLIPSLTAFNTLNVSHGNYGTKNFMFHGDLDFQYRLFQENTLSLVAMAGINYTHIYSKNYIYKFIPNQEITDSTWAGLGPSVGAALEMRMSSHIDLILAGRYSFAGIQAGDPALEQGLLIAPLSSPIIQFSAVYYFRSRSKGYSGR